MANHVSTWIDVQSDKQEVFQKMEDMFRGSNYKDHGDTMWLYRKLYDLDESAEYDRGDYTEAMGAKWCYIEDVTIENDFFEASLTSAWDYPRYAIEQLWNILSEVDEEVSISFTFEDEGLNFIGGGCIWRGELMDTAEDWSERWPDIESDDYDEKYDELWDLVGDAKSQMMHDMISEVRLEMADYDEIEDSEEYDEEELPF